MLAKGVYFAPSAFEAAFISSAHQDAELDQTLEAARRVFARMGAARS
jgi:glutamate-1-semialdehyde 2,1-aminomutase